MKSTPKLILCLLLTLSIAHAAEENSSSTKQEVLETASSSSDLSLTNVTVTGTASAGDDITLNECLIAQSLKAGKSIIIHQSKVLGNVSAGDNVSIEDSQVEGKVTCSSNHLILNDSQISAIELKCITSFFTSKKGVPQVLELHNCTVKDITFEGGNGEVILHGNSTVTGKITGGKIRSNS